MGARAARRGFGSGLPHQREADDQCGGWGTEFARELPRFVAERSGASSAWLYLKHLQRMEEEALSAEPAEGDFMIETPEQRTAPRARLARQRKLLTAMCWGGDERFARSSGKQVKADEQCGRQGRRCSLIHQERARRHSCSQCSKGQN